jgi:hypothetical protein
MRTHLDNQLNLTPVSGPVTPRIHQSAFMPSVREGGMRSLPAQIGSARPMRRAHPNIPKEHPSEISRSAAPLEPAREPVDATIADPTFRP